MRNSQVDGPHPIDLYVGLRIRQRRKEIGVTLEKLAEALELTYQQVQKYERGVNRVSASRLFDMARALRATPAYFFEGFGGDLDAEWVAPERREPEFPASPEDEAFLRAFSEVGLGERRKLLELIRAVVAVELEGTLRRTQNRG